MFVQGLLGAINNPGTLVPGSPGYTVSAAPQRAASQAGYNTAVANADNVYGQATGLITARDPGITQNYAAATAAIQANARQRAIDDMGRQEALQNQAIQGAAALGLQGVAAPSATSRTGESAAAEQAAYQKIADSWAGFNSGAAQRAVGKNDAVANSFTWENGQQQNALAALLQRALASEQDRHVGGSSARLVGGATTAQQIAGYNDLLGYSNKDAGTSLNVAKAQNSARNNTAKNNLAAAVAKARYGAVPASPGAMGY